MQEHPAAGRGGAREGSVPAQSRSQDSTATGRGVSAPHVLPQSSHPIPTPLRPHTPPHRPQFRAAPSSCQGKGLGTREGLGQEGRVRGRRAFCLGSLPQARRLTVCKDAELPKEGRTWDCAPTCMSVNPGHSLPFQKVPLTLHVLTVAMQPEHCQDGGPARGIRTLQQTGTCLRPPLPPHLPAPKGL